MIATPGRAAQRVADQLVAVGVTSILNFAPCVLSVPEGVDVRKVDLAIELQILSFHEHRKASLTALPATGAGLAAVAARHPGGGRHVNLLVVGASYRTAPVATLERLAVPRRPHQTLERLLAQPYVGEAVVVSTCNRVEVYAAVSGFHGGLGDICAVLAAQAGRRRPSSPPTSTCTTTPPPSTTSSGSPPGSTRWSSARRRSSASCGTPTTGDPAPTPPAGCCTS